MLIKRAEYLDGALALCLVQFLVPGRFNLSASNLFTDRARTYNAHEAISWNRGAHRSKFGVEYFCRRTGWQASQADLAGRRYRGFNIRRCAAYLSTALRLKTSGKYSLSAQRGSRLR